MCLEYMEGQQNVTVHHAKPKLDAIAYMVKMKLIIWKNKGQSNQ